jgi:FixJ family two-component response regulator
LSAQARDQRGDIEVGEPETTRWSLGDLTLCGQHGYMRPCQRVNCKDVAANSVPLARLCESDRETVFVVDDDDDLRVDLVELVEGLGFPAMGCASGADLLAALPAYKTGCVLLDIRLPGQDGLAVQEWINRAGIALPVVFISGVQDISTVVHCMKAGAFDFLQKPFGEMALRSAVSSAIGHSRKRHCRLESEKMVRQMISSLTPTETHVAGMISRGYPTKLIAAEMQRSENTVKIHRHRIFNKLKVSTAASVANLVRHLVD